MTTTPEEKTVLLYTLYTHGGKLSKARAIDLIISNKFLLPREGDDKIVATGETRLENRIAWSRKNLQMGGQISPVKERGKWEISAKGRQCMEGIAFKCLEAEKNAELCGEVLQWERFSPEFFNLIKQLGRDLQEKAQTQPA